MAKTTTGPAAEIDVMGRISQQAAGWALDCSPRTLRDHPEIKRAADGTYSVQDLVNFARGSGGLPTLSDEQFESALLIADQIPTECIARIKRAVETLVREIGGDPVAALGAVALVLWNDKLDMLGQCPEQFEFGPKLFDVVHQCEGKGCGRYRLGRRWIKAEPPEGQPTIGALCPSCQRGFGRSRVPVVDVDLDADELEMEPARRERRK